MKLTVIDYEPHPRDYHVCKDERGDTVRVDLMTSGEFVDESNPETLIGKTVEIDWMSGYVFIAHRARLARVAGEPA